MFRFSNAGRRVDALYARIYLPSATDSSSRGGNAARITEAVRRQLALDTRFRLVPLNEARVAVDIQVVDVNRITTAVSECKKEGDLVAAESRSCDDIENDFSVADASAERENALADVQVRIVDLNDGKLLFSRSFPGLASGEYELVGDADTRKGLARTPPLHALRYAENADAAMGRVGEALAGQVTAALSSLDSSLAQAPASPTR